MSAPVVRFGLIIVGDEILAGKREDKHLPKVIALLNARGLRLAWAHYARDSRVELTQLLARTFAEPDVVFSCGGIGATPDDHTRQAAAAALGVDCVLHREAGDLIAERCAEMAREGRGSADMSSPENQQRLKMGEFPRGAAIIPNPFNRIPGFSIRNHWFMPGFPAMAWPMIEYVLDTHYRQLFFSGAINERSLIVYEVPESALAPIMEEIEREFPGVVSFSLPSLGDGGDGRPARRHVELGVKAPATAAADLEQAYALMQRRLSQMSAQFERPPG